MAQATHLHDADPSTFRDAVRPLASLVARRGTMQGVNPSRRHKAAAAASLLATGSSGCGPILPVGSGVGVFLGVVAVVATPLLWNLFATALARAYAVALTVTLVAATVAPWVVSLPSAIDIAFVRLVLVFASVVDWIVLVFSHGAGSARWRTGRRCSSAQAEATA